MAIVIKTPLLVAPPPPPITVFTNEHISLKSSKPLCLSFTHRSISTKLSRISSLPLVTNPSLRLEKFVPFASHGETETTEGELAVQEPEIEDSSDGAVGVEEVAGALEHGPSNKEAAEAAETETASSVIIASLKSYREALASNDEGRTAEIEAFLKSIEDEKIDLERKVDTTAEELLIENDRILRISADFDNFRKRTERQRMSLVTNAQGEVVEKLLPVLDNFERAKAQIKVETEGEEKINNSYQSIYKQFIEILGSLGVLPVETIGNPFDPLLHEAIMREDSAEFEEGIILDEFRKGFTLGDRLLRPSMVKVSAGPGPAKPEGETSSETSGSEGDSREETETETSEEGIAETEYA